MFAVPCEAFVVRLRPSLFPYPAMVHGFRFCSWTHLGSFSALLIPFQRSSGVDTGGSATCRPAAQTKNAVGQRLNVPARQRIRKSLLYERPALGGARESPNPVGLLSSGLLMTNVLILLIIVKVPS